MLVQPHQRALPAEKKPGLNLVHPRSPGASTDFMRCDQASRGNKLNNGVARRPMVQ